MAMREDHGDRLFGHYGFLDALNPTFTLDVPVQHGRVDPGHGWYDTDYLGIDQGPILAMIENHRSEPGLANHADAIPTSSAGLQAAGFTGGWLDETGDSPMTRPAGPVSRLPVRRPAGLVVLLALAGCGRDTRRVATRCDFWVMGREGEVVQELVRDFEAQNPDVRVRVQQIPWSAAHEKLLTAYVGGPRRTWPSWATPGCRNSTPWGPWRLWTAGRRFDGGQPGRSFSRHLGHQRHRRRCCTASPGTWTPGCCSTAPICWPRRDTTEPPRTWERMARRPWRRSQRAAGRNTTPSCCRSTNGPSR